MTALDITYEAICVVWINGMALNASTIRKISTVQLKLRKKKAKSGSMVIRDPDGELFDSEIFAKSRPIAFMMGWVHEATPVGPFVIKSYKKTFPETGDPSITVRFQDRTHRMNKKQRRKRFTGKPEDILKRIADRHGLGYDITAPEGLVFTDDFPLIQANATDAKLMQQLADRYGYEWGVDGQTLYFRPPQTNDEISAQSEVSVLSYRLNDFSLRSFDPDIKFTRGGKKKASSIVSQNLDLLGKSLSQAASQFGINLDRDSLSGGDPVLAAISKVLPGQEKDDNEKNDSGEGQVGVDFWSGAIDSATEWIQGDGKDEKSLVYADQARVQEEDSVESMPGERSGAATASDLKEAKRRAAAKVSRASEIVTGTAVPTIASMKYHEGDAVIVEGVGERLSGKYTTKEVDQVYANTGAGGTFTTKLKVYRRTFKASSKSKKIIADNANNPQVAANIYDKPRSESEYELNVWTGQGKARKVNGKDQ